MKFAPGPWKVSGSKDFVKTADDKAICRMAQNKSVWEWAVAAGSLENSANAALIASAPDLYEACKYVVKWHREHDSGEGELFALDFVTTCIAALAKVEGREGDG